MKNSLIIGIGMVIIMGFILVSCTDMERTNIYDPAADYHVPPPPPPLTISPAGIQSIQSGNKTIQFTAEGGTSPYTWEVVDITGMAGFTPTIGPTTGLFNSGMTGYSGSCKVKLTDSEGKNVLSGSITVTM